MKHSVLHLSLPHNELFENTWKDSVFDVERNHILFPLLNENQSALIVTNHLLIGHPAECSKHTRLRCQSSSDMLDKVKLFAFQNEFQKECPNTQIQGLRK